MSTTANDPSSVPRSQSSRGGQVRPAFASKRRDRIGVHAGAFGLGRLLRLRLPFLPRPLEQ